MKLFDEKERFVEWKDDTGIIDHRSRFLSQRICRRLFLLINRLVFVGRRANEGGLGALELGLIEWRDTTIRSSAPPLKKVCVYRFCAPLTRSEFIGYIILSFIYLRFDSS